jgi:hypothetical protein
LSPQFAEILDEVVGEGIVVIDDEDHANAERGLTTEDTDSTEEGEEGKIWGIPVRRTIGILEPTKNSSLTPSSPW